MKPAKLYSTIAWIRAVTIFVLSLAVFNLYGQEQWEKEGEGEIKDVEIEIVKDRQIVLPRASRNFEKVPPRAFEPIEPAITYELKNFQLASPDYNPSIRPLKLKQEDLSKVYGNYLSAGLGNYSSFFFEGSATTKRDKNKFLGAHAYTRSFGSGPVDDKNSAASNTSMQLFGKAAGKAVTFSGDANYDNRGTYFYGYDLLKEPNRSSIRQTYSIFSFHAGLENTRQSDFNYSLNGGYSYLHDHYNASEGETSLLFNSAYKIDKTSKFLFSADYFLINRKDSLVTGSSRHLLRVKPAYQFNTIEHLTVTVGANVALENDNLNGKSFHVYPNVKAQYALGSSWEVYGLATGDIDKVNLHTLSAENLWLNSNVNISHTNRALEFRGGLQGKIGRNVALHGGISVATLKNYYYYLNANYTTGDFPVLASTPLPNKFNVLYDGSTQRVNPFGELTYSRSESFRLGLRGDYFSYQTANLQEPWHRPTYRVQINSRYNLYEKISFEAGLQAQGGMKALDQAQNLVTLDPALDLSIKARYFLSKQFSAFVDTNNVLSSKYPLYQNYPVRGFQVLVGVSWSF